ncbi:MAG: RloB family protein [Bacteroidota bacterium]
MYFLIVCEDEKTEPAYFDKFRSFFPERTLYLECVGTGRHQLGVVEKAIQVRTEIQDIAQKQIDFTWVVFDKDDADRNETTIAKFADAYASANRNKISIALSNEVFELWLLLHLEDVDPRTQIPRQDIYKRLEEAIQRLQIAAGESEGLFEYRHGKLEVLNMINRFGDENKAIERAVALQQYFKDVEPIDANPCTTVDRLVKELREWIRYYNY